MTLLGIVASQNYPRTVSPPVSGFSFWLDADDATSFTFSSSNVVSAWADKSGNGNNATQATVANQPTKESSVLNGKPGVRFSANADKCLGLGTQIGGTTQTTFMVISTPSGWTNSTGGFAMIFSSNALGVAGNGGLVGGSWTGGFANERILWYTQSSGNQSIGIAQNGSNISSGGHILSIDHTATGSRDIKLDNVSQSVTSSGNWSNSLYPGNYDRIGNYDVTGGGSGFIGDICEVILYPSQLSSGDITLVYDYLKTKWGTP